MTITLTALQQQRRDTASNWTSNNTVLLAGEWGIETDTKKFKIGDGTTAWQSLDYIPIPDVNRLLTGNLTVGGDLTVNGTTTTISTQNLLVEDKNIEIGKVSTPTDTTASGGGITLKGATDKTFNWLDATDSWTSSENIALGDNKKLQLGDSQDVQVFWDGSAGFITNQGGGNLHFNSDSVLIKNAANTKSYIRAYNNSSVELYHNNVKKAETSATGFDVTGNVDLSSAESNSSNTSQFKLSNLTIGQHQNVGSYRFANAGTGSFLFTADNINFFNKDVNKNLLRLSTSGVELYHDNVKQCETSSVGLDFPVDKKIRMNTNLTIYRDTNHAYIDHAGGALKLRSDTLRINDLTNDHSMIHADADGAVKLYHDNVKKAETSSTGFDVTGNIAASGTISGTLANGVIATTQSASDNSTKVATTAYVDNQVTAGGGGGGGTGGGGEQIFFESENAMDNDYTISTNHNAIVAGPLTINGTLTINSPSVVTIP